MIERIENIKILSESELRLDRRLAVILFSNIEKENLPYPYVEYPASWSGAFPGFRKVKDGPMHFCACQKQAIQNYLSFWPQRAPLAENYGSKNFPYGLHKQIKVRDQTSISEFISSLKFLSKLCHECNRRAPPPPARQPDSADPFSTLFRCYVSKIGFENGIDLQNKKILDQKSSDWVHKIVTPEIINRIATAKERGVERKIAREIWSSAFKKVTDHVHTLTRHSFGFPSKGHRLISETILFLRTRSAFSETKIIRHYRRPELRRMSLDIYIPALSVAIEYQGNQHFEAVSHWGGAASLKLTQDRDVRKKELCETLGI
ncbi:hypothetical protein OAG63_00830, partial [Methylacidiphilales bacterium]|nr:hypothetical protein [Candidatus Methylacidiphilales bacterium]